jgi:two-component system, chemotaxis family, response regulator Rcp1
MTASRKLTVCLAEDNRADVLLVREALKRHRVEVDLVVKHDGEQMLRFVDQIERGEAPPPHVVLLDLNLPRRTGIEVLARIRQSAALERVPVIIVSSSDALNDREAARRLGATLYFMKPSSYEGFMELGEIVRTVLSAAGPSQ